MKKFSIALGILSMAASCPPKPPIPTPTPTPTPCITCTPEKGVPVSPESLLRPAPNAKVKNNDGSAFDAFMAVPCCRQFKIDGVEKNSLWPMASEVFMDYTGDNYGTNFFHFRMGPFYADDETESEWKEFGGPYKLGTSLEWNPVFWQKVRDLVWYAHLKFKAKVEVVVIDTWGCKYSQNGNRYNPWPEDAINQCGTVMHPEHERYIRKVVSELTCFGNVIWLLDNEGNGVHHPKAQWFLQEQAIIRDEEKKSECNFTHMIGTNTDFPEVRNSVDYVAIHNGAALTQPVAGRWTINNEHNPAFSPEVEAQNFKTARNIGLSYGLWRAEMDDDEFVKTLELFRNVRTAPEPTCPVVTPDRLRMTIHVRRQKPNGVKILEATPKRKLDNGELVPILPEGDPNRAACEIKAMGGTCPIWDGDCLTPGIPETCPITYDSINLGQPWPANLVCSQPPDPNHPDVFITTPQGKGLAYACSSTDPKVCSNRIEVDQ